jgi:hypothetical protein
MHGSDPSELKELEARIQANSVHIFGSKPLGALAMRLNILATIDFLALKTTCFRLNMDGAPIVYKSDTQRSFMYCGRKFIVTRSPSGLKIGDKVEGRYLNGNWYPAVISSKNSNGTFTLDWQDGDTQDRIKKTTEIRIRNETKQVINEQDQTQVVCRGGEEQCTSCKYSQLYPHRFLTKKKNAQWIRRLFTLAKEKTLQNIFDGQDISERNSYERTPLHLASISGRHDAVLALVNINADMNVTDKDQKSPLDSAGNIRCSEMLKLLGADNWTPLMVAAEKGEEKFNVYMQYRNSLICLNQQITFETSFVEHVGKNISTKDMGWKWGFVDKTSMQIDENGLSVKRIGEDSEYSCAVGNLLLSSGIHKWAIYVENVETMWVGIARGVEEEENGLSSSPGECGEYMLVFESDGSEPVVLGENMPSFLKVDKRNEDAEDKSENGSESRETRSEEPDGEEQNEEEDQEDCSDGEEDNRSSNSVGGYGINFTSNQTIEFELDMDERTLKVRVDGGLQAVARNIDSEGIRPFICLGCFESAKILFNSEISHDRLGNINISADDRDKAFDNKMWTPEMNKIMLKHPNSGNIHSFCLIVIRKRSWHTRDTIPDQSAINTMFSFDHIDKGITRLKVLNLQISLQA